MSQNLISYTFRHIVKPFQAAYGKKVSKKFTISNLKLLLQLKLTLTTEIHRDLCNSQFRVDMILVPKRVVAVAIIHLRTPLLH